MVQRAIRCSGYKKGTNDQCNFRGLHVKFPRPGGNGRDLERCTAHRFDKNGCTPIFPGCGDDADDDNDDGNSNPVAVNIGKLRMPTTPSSVRRTSTRLSSKAPATPKGKIDVTSFERDTLLAMDPASENWAFGKSLADARHRQIREAIDPKENLHNLMDPRKKVSESQKSQVLTSAAVSSFERLNLSDAATNSLANIVHTHDRKFMEQEKTNAYAGKATRQVEARLAQLELKMQKDESAKKKAAAMTGTWLD